MIKKFNITSFNNKKDLSNQVFFAKVNGYNAIAVDSQNFDIENFACLSHYCRNSNINLHLDDKIFNYHVDVPLFVLNVKLKNINTIDDIVYEKPYRIILSDKFNFWVNIETLMHYEYTHKKYCVGFKHKDFNFSLITSNDIERVSEHFKIKEK